MLKRFNVKNFLSFSCREGEKSQEFSMIPGKVQRKREHIYDDGTNKLLKFAAVYGANASGKSNFVKALRAMQMIILAGAPDGFTEMYCRIDPLNKEKISYFEVELILDGKCYAYGFEVLLSRASFIEEWLVELRPDKEIELFYRSVDGGTKFAQKWVNGTELAQELNFHAKRISEDDSSLLLNIMNQKMGKFYEEHPEVKILQEVYVWFERQLDINFPDRPLSDLTYFSKTDRIDEIQTMISAFGTGITKASLVEIEKEKLMKLLPPFIIDKIEQDLEDGIVDLRKNNERKEVAILLRSEKNLFSISVNREEEIRYETLELCHGNQKIPFALKEESDGTIRLLDLLEVLLSDGNRTFVIDELDRCLHPNLTYRFIETFLRYAEKKNIQLIVTTHESRLLDLDLLRRDEVWFANKRDTGESDLYSLEEFNERYDKKIDKAYLEGRYRGVPVFDSIFPVCGEESS